MNYISSFRCALQNEAEVKWLCKRYEKLHQEELGDTDKKALAREMLKSQNFDHFLATKFASVKRYGGEGAEGMMGFFTESLLNASTREAITAFQDLF